MQLTLNPFGSGRAVIQPEDRNKLGRYRAIWLTILALLVLRYIIALSMRLAIQYYPTSFI